MRDASAALEHGDPETASEKLRSALGVWRGPALSDFARAEFARPAIVRLEELRAAAIELRLDADLALGRHAQLVSELQALVVEHPAREQLRAQLMLALFCSGRQAEALAAYQDARRTLVEDFGLEPSPALQELEGKILRHDPALTAPVSGSTSARGAGRHQRGILVVTDGDARTAGLLEIAAPLARAADRELILASLVSNKVDLPQAARSLHEHREALVASGINARAASFVSRDPGADALRLAVEQAVDLLLVGASETLVEAGKPSRDLELILSRSPCDVAILAAGERPFDPGPARPVLVPFGGAKYDWAAVELASWLARAHGAPLRLAGTESARTTTGDPSRLLARASLYCAEDDGPSR